MATAHMSRSGSRVVRRWNCMPGHASVRTTGLSKYLPESRMNSNATPAINGMHAMRVRCCTRFVGLPMNVNTTMLTSTTRNRNVVPQRGCSRENFCTFSGVSGTSASSAWIALCSAP